MGWRLAQLILRGSVRDGGAERGAVSRQRRHREGGVFLCRLGEMRDGAGDTRLLETSDVSCPWVVYLVSWLVICTSLSFKWSE